MNNKTIRNTLLIFSGVLILVFLFIFKFDFSNFVKAISGKISVGFYGFLCALIILQLFCRSIRFNLLFKSATQEDLSFSDSFYLTGASFLVAMATPNKVGDLTRGFFYKNRGLEVTAISLIEYMFDTITIVGIAFLGVVFLFQQYTANLLFAFIIMILLSGSIYFLYKCEKLKKFFAGHGWYQKIHVKMLDFKKHLESGIKNKSILAVGFILSCIYNAIYFYIFYLILCQLDAKVSMMNVLFSASVGMIIGSLTCMPMGIGTRDVSIFGLLCSIGTDSDIAVSSVLIMRSLSVPLLIASAFCYFITINRFVDKK